MPRDGPRRGLRRLRRDPRTSLSSYTEEGEEDRTRRSEEEGEDLAQYEAKVSEFPNEGIPEQYPHHQGGGLEGRGPRTVLWQAGGGQPLFRSRIEGWMQFQFVLQARVFDPR